MFRNVSMNTLNGLRFLLNNTNRTIFISNTSRGSNPMFLHRFRRFRRTLITILMINKIRSTLTPNRLRPYLRLLPLNKIRRRQRNRIHRRTERRLIRIPFTVTTRMIRIRIRSINAFLCLFPHRNRRTVPVLNIRRFPTLFETTNIRTFTRGRGKIILLMKLNTMSQNHQKRMVGHQAKVQ